MEENKVNRLNISEEQKKKIIKCGLFTLVGVICLLLVVAIVYPKAENKSVEGGTTFQTNIPSPDNKELVGDKLEAIEKQKIESKAEERQRLMMDVDSYLRNKNDEPKQEELDLMNPEAAQESEQGYIKSGSAQPRETIKASTNAYRDMNATLSNFYERPQVDTEKEELKAKIAELEQQQQAQQVAQMPTMEEQMALMEKSYEMAAKYSSNSATTAQHTTEPTQNSTQQSNDIHKNGKALIATIKQVREVTVSSLAQQMSNKEFVVEYSQPRNMGFNTAVGKKSYSEKNTISACVHNNQTIVDGMGVRMRLLEPMIAGDKLLPKGALISGFAKIGGERLNINITTLEHGGVIIPVELTVVDSDGQDGIYIPGSMELSAIKEVAANLGSNMGTTINLNQQDAGSQILTDLGKGAIQGASQYIAKKMQIVKVHLKSGYRVMLYQEKNN